MKVQEGLLSSHSSDCPLPKDSAGLDNDLIRKKQSVATFKDGVQHFSFR